ncbi:MAG: threonine/serine exporter family protein [Clostridia bacterium]|nr:threonine/serine exporter family protein [Clostridia bacterium]
MIYLYEIFAAFAGTLGFGFLFNIRGKKLWLAAAGGMLSWVLFLVLGLWIESQVLRYFLVSVLLSLYAEILARLLKTPSTTFCIVSLIPLIPGGSLYYTMAYALQEHQLFVGSAVHTLQLAAALSLGIVLVTALMRSIRDFKNKYHNH